MKIFVLFCIWVSSVFSQDLPINSIVKVYASVATPDYKQPWQAPSRYQYSGSGVLIENDYIITNAHVITDSKFTQVSKGNDSKRYTVSIEFISHQADLALLKVHDKSFYNDTTPLKFSEDVKTGDSVTVLGYPFGGNNLSTTKGVISRIEHHNYVYSYEYMLSIQIDAAINSGNSGGAAIDEKNNIIGIVMQSYSKQDSDNIGYIIPSIIVKTFLEDIKDGKVDGFDNSNSYISATINPSMKDYYHINTNQGVLQVKVQSDDDALKVGDIIIEMEGHKVYNDGTADTQYGTQMSKYYEQIKPVGNTIDVKVIRDGKILDLKYKLKRNNSIIYYEYGKEPRYVIFGGLVFTVTTKNYLYAKNIYSDVTFETFYTLKEDAKGIEEGVIIQQEKFDHSVNEGYSPYLQLVKSVNGTKIKNFQHFVQLLDDSKGKFTVIEYLDTNSKTILDTKKARDSFEEIKNIFGLNTDRKLK